MTTLIEYAATNFPGHVIEPIKGDAVLRPNTTIAHVTGAGDGADLARQIHEELPAAEVTVVLVRPVADAVDDTGNSALVARPPVQPLAPAAVIAAAFPGVIVGLVAGMVSGSFLIGSLVGVIAAAVGAAVGRSLERGDTTDVAHTNLEQRTQHPTVALVATTTSDDAGMADSVLRIVRPRSTNVVSGTAWPSVSDRTRLG